LGFYPSPASHCFIGVIIWLRGGNRFSHGQETLINFNDVNGLREGAIVQMMGVRVGSIEKIIVKTPIMPDCSMAMWTPEQL